MKNFNLKKILLSSAMFLSILSCNNIFAMKYLPSSFSAQKIEGTDVLISDVEKTADSFSKNAFECLVANLEGLHQYAGFSEYIFSNQYFYKQLFRQLFIEDFISQDPHIISRLFEKSNFLEELKINLSDKMARDLIHRFQVGVCQSSPDRWGMIESDPKFIKFTEKFEKIILESFEKMAQSSWTVKGVMQKTSSGVKFTARSSMVIAATIVLLLAFKGMVLINKGYWRDGMAVVSVIFAIGIVSAVLYKFIARPVSGIVYPIVSQGRQACADGHAFLYGPEQKSDKKGKASKKK